MENQRKTRKRAVRLTPDAVEMLTKALSESWYSNPGPGKLTREEKARMLGVSLATSERILKGKGVDRTSLTLAFRSLEIVWDDEYCENVETEPQASLVDEAVSTLGDLQPSPQPPTAARRSLRFVLSLGITALLIFAASIAFRTIQTPENWEHTFNDLVDQADREYNSARYSQAMAYANQAILLSRKHENAPRTAEALRISGDLAMVTGDAKFAYDRYSEAKLLRRTFGYFQNLPPINEKIGNAETELNRFKEAEASYRECIKGFQENGEPSGMAMGYRGLGTVAHRQGDLEAAEKAYRQALSHLARETDREMEVDIRARLALVDRDRQKFSEARAELEDCLDFWKRRGHTRWMAKTRLQLGTVEVLADNSGRAKELLELSQAAYQELGDYASERDCQNWLNTLKSKPLVIASH